MSELDELDVLVVGAGPTGLMLACQLARRGLRPRIIDKNAGPSRATKALGVQARTLEIYARLGIAGGALELGAPTSGATMWAGGRRAARVPLGDIGRDLSPFPYLLVLGQDDNERLLGAKLGELGLAVEWDTELVGLAQSAEHVDATLQGADGSTRPLRARWIAGCDGSRSAVRRLCDIDFPGAPYEHVFFVADTRAKGPMQAGELNVYLWRSGFHLFFPMRGAHHWRVVGILPSHLRDRDGVEFDALRPSLEAEVGGALAFERCEWFSTYRIHHRRAAHFRCERAFLLGDAAHIHSPVGAQGMNTGLQDAYNLAWKLALVVARRARPELLDSYEAERVPVAERLLSTTDRAFAAAVSSTRLARFVRTRLFPRGLSLAMRIGAARALAFRTISQIGVAYPESPLSPRATDLPKGAPRAGERFPWMRLRLRPNEPPEDLFAALDDREFQLLAFGAAALEPVSGVRALVVPDDPTNTTELARARVPHPSAYLLRPDGHVGLAGRRLEAAAVRAYLHERVGLV